MDGGVRPVLPTLVHHAWPRSPGLLVRASACEKFTRGPTRPSSRLDLFLLVGVAPTAAVSTATLIGCRPAPALSLVAVLVRAATSVAASVPFISVRVALPIPFTPIRAALAVIFVHTGRAPHRGHASPERVRRS